MLPIIIIIIVIDCGSFCCNPKPVPMNVSSCYPFRITQGPGFPPALSAHTPLAQTSTTRTHTQCPGVAAGALRPVLYCLPQYCEGQLELLRIHVVQWLEAWAPFVRRHT